MTIYDDGLDEKMTKLLKHDPLAEAERRTGKPWHDSEETQALGLLAQIEHASSLRAMLTTCVDSVYGMEIKPWREILAAEGFERVFALPFKGRSFTGEPAPVESLEIHWKASEGLLLRFDTFHGHVNAATVYYNWRSLDPDRRSYTESGFWRGGAGNVWVGDHDAREGLRLKLHNLRTHGELLSSWEERPFLWLNHYMDDPKAHDGIGEERLAALPAAVRHAITP